MLDSLSPALQESLLRSTPAALFWSRIAPPAWTRPSTNGPNGGARATPRHLPAPIWNGLAAEPDQELAWEYHTALVTERNARMARRLADWLEGEETCFVTLGLLHLVLEGDSVLSCLEEMGYAVERIVPEND